MLEAFKGDEKHLLGLPRETEMTHDQADGFDTLFYFEIAEIETTVFGGAKGDCATDVPVVAHFLECGGYHWPLKAV